jgi:hypothetical protein
MSKEDSRVAELLAYWAIQNTLLAYARGVDRSDVELVRDCFHPGALDHHGALYRGPVEGFLPVLRHFLSRYEVTMHHLSPPHIEIRGKVAFVETYAICVHRRRLSDDSGRDDVIGIRYLDQFELRSHEWRIARRRVVTEWRRVDSVPAGKVRPVSDEDWGRRDRLDWVYRFADDLET